MELLKLVGKNFSIVAAIFAVLMVCVTYLLNASYYEYIEKGLGIGKYDKKQSTTFLALIIITFVIGSEIGVIVYLDKFENTLKKLNVNYNYVPISYSYFMCSIILIVLCLLVNKWFKENILNSINKNIKIKSKTIYDTIGGIFLILISLINGYMVVKYLTSETFNEINSFLLAIIIIANMVFCVIIYGIVTFQSKLVSLEENIIYLKDNEKIEKCKIIYINDNKTCIVINSKMVYISTSEIIKIE